MEDAVARRERLKALKAAAEAVGEGAPDAAPEQDSDKPVLKFRNYAVKDEKRIEHEKVAPAKPPKFEAPIVEKKPEEADQEELLINVAPKKANWDLKRDIEGKLEKLERRTQRAIVEIMQEEEQRRLQEEGQAD
mmetsp:Transcript_21131/g.46272  ORF Transcript_21131/g.46272 Transcript_21131/m.46272 type:complete len:134 (+) Transcript_21131:79-480(+)|eukprot:CAMPEP_0202900988 /NCGR_PEP_ID=MMETSP1392-20130828/12592_1 /ASSEMBLY_ACC=CAM_ASM_000868 /TAXON_ID=225041 /ORGANISM="Chlamydomonas chlamydogama, Strain SAG 11-48b" /LENGTH=133 /DNA_ID=CAMNT_0049587467 /DNA_START=76 /DNA_END=477 /DNA_ORIENTATION=+